MIPLAQLQIMGNEVLHRSRSSQGERWGTDDHDHVDDFVHAALGELGSALNVGDAAPEPLAPGARGELLRRAVAAEPVLTRPRDYPELFLLLQIDAAGAVPVALFPSVEEATAFGELLAERVLGLSDTPQWTQSGGGLVMATEHVRWIISGMTPTPARALVPVLAALAAKIGAAAP